MAENTGSRMAAFARRNEQPTSVYDDLKASVPNPAFSKPMKRNVSRASLAAQPRATNIAPQQQARSTAFGQVSSIGATSTTPEEAYARPTYHAHSNQIAQQAGHDQEDYIEGADDDLMIVGERQIPEPDTGPIPPQVRVASRNSLRQPLNEHQYDTGLSSKAVKGDSYPPTTSGIPSMSDQHEQRDEQGSAGNQVTNAQPPRAKFEVTLPQHRSQAANPVLLPRPERPNQFITARQLHHDDTSRAEPGVVMSANTLGQTKEESVPTQTPRAAVENTPRQQNMITPPGTVHQRQQEAVAESTEEVVEESQGSQNEEVVLDYEVNELMQMEFEQLQSEAFDRATERERALPPDSSDDLATRLLQAKKSNARPDDRENHRSALLSSLTIEEWDEAGEWFVDQFSDVAKRLQDARKKKRNLSKNYEKTVAARHSKVTKKSKLIEDAMSLMRSQGQNLFTHTPQKRGGK